MRLSKNCPGEYRKMVEFVLIPKNGGIRASTGKGSNLCEYQKMAESRSVPKKVESVRVSKNCPGEYEKIVESV